MKIKDLLTDESKWCQGAYAKDIHGNFVRAVSPDAVAWCLRGASWKCYAPKSRLEFDNSKFVEVDNMLWKAVFALGYTSITSYNDAPGRKFKDIVAFVEKLDI